MCLNVVYSRDVLWFRMWEFTARITYVMNLLSKEHKFVDQLSSSATGGVYAFFVEALDSQKQAVS